MEPHPWGHRHPDDPRTSTRWVQLTNHSPCIAVSNEVRALSSKPMWSHWWLDSRSCLSRSLHVLHYNQCCFHLNPTVTKVNISTCFIIQCLCLTSWKTKSIYFVLFFSPHYWLYWFSLWLFGSCFCFLLFFAMRVCVCVVFCVFPPCAFHLALLSDFLSSRLRRVAAAAVVAAATVAVWLHGNSISKQCDRCCEQLERDRRIGKQHWRKGAA